MRLCGCIPTVLMTNLLHLSTITSFCFLSHLLGMAHLLDSRVMKRDSEVFRVTEQQFEECKQANDNGAEYILEPKEGEMKFTN